MFLLEILLRDGHKGREVVRVWIWCEDLRVGSTFQCDPSPELGVQQLLDYCLLTADVVVLQVRAVEVRFECR